MMRRGWIGAAVATSGCGKAGCCGRAEAERDRQGRRRDFRLWGWRSEGSGSDGVWQRRRCPLPSDLVRSSNDSVSFAGCWCCGGPSNGGRRLRRPGGRSSEAAAVGTATRAGARIAGRRVAASIGEATGVDGSRRRLTEPREQMGRGVDWA